MGLESNQSPPDESRAYQIYITVSIATFLVALTTVARIATKVGSTLKLGWDDYWIMFGASLNLIANGCDYKATAAGFGRHLGSLSDETAVSANKFAQIAVITAIFAVWTTDISICCFLYSLIKGTRRFFTWFIWAMMAFTTITAFIGGLLWGLQAKPIQKLWDPAVPGTRASSKLFTDSLYVDYSLRVCAEILYSLCPMYFLWNIQMSWSRKLPVIGLTLLGLLITVVTILDIVFIPEFLEEDTTWALVPEFICDIIERNLLVFVVNLPAIWMLIKQVSTKSSDGSGGGTPRFSKWSSKYAFGSAERPHGHPYTEFPGRDGGIGLTNVVVKGGRDPYAEDENIDLIPQQSSVLSNGQPLPKDQNIRVDKEFWVENHSEVTGQV